MKVDAWFDFLLSSVFWGFHFFQLYEFVLWSVVVFKHWYFMKYLLVSICIKCKSLQATLYCLIHDISAYMLTMSLKTVSFVFYPSSNWKLDFHILVTKTFDDSFANLENTTLHICIFIDFRPPLIILLKKLL